MDKSSVAVRLLEVIEAMSEDEQLALLKELEERLSKGKRDNKREPFFTTVDYSIEDRFYKDYIQDISDGGVFIETREPFRVGQEILLTFSRPNTEQYVKVTGEIARMTSRGIGVKFKPVDQVAGKQIEPLLQS